MQKPRIIVLITYFEGIHLLRRSLLSVDEQTIQPDDVVVLNDGLESIDLPLYSKIRPRIYSYNENLGQFGIIHRFLASLHETAKIFLLDYDDVWLDNHIAVHLNTCEPWVSSSGIIFNEKWIRPIKIPSSKSLISQTNIVGSTSRVSINSDLLIKALPIPTDLETGKDWFVWWKLYNLGYECFRLNTPTVLYYEHNNAVTSQRLKLLQGRHKLFKEFNVNYLDRRTMSLWNQQLLALLINRGIYRVDDLRLMLPFSYAGYVMILKVCLWKITPSFLKRLVFKKYINEKIQSFFN